MSDEAPKTNPEEVKPAWAAQLEDKLIGAVTHLQDSFLAFDVRLRTVEEIIDEKVVPGPIEIPRYSNRVKALEQTDVSVIQRLENLEKKTDAQNVTLDKILGNPEVRKVLQALAGLIIALSGVGTWMAYQKLSALQARAEERQPAPSVTVVPVFMPAIDAGASDAHP